MATCKENFQIFLQHFIDPVAKEEENIFFDNYRDSILEHQIQVGAFSVLKTKNMRNLKPEDVDQLITISGMLIQETQKALLQCQVCAHTALVKMDHGQITEPACVTWGWSEGYRHRSIELFPFVNPRVSNEKKWMLNICMKKQNRNFFSEKHLELLKETSRKPDIYERLASDLAPSMKDFSHTGRARLHAEINILLCSDAGTSKSQQLQSVYSLVPWDQYTSGKGSSAVDLTAYIVKDPEMRQLVLQTRSLVLSDSGICCDKFEKMSESTRLVLHAVMEQLTLSIAKAGIICQLNARTCILAAANPIESQQNPKKTTSEIIQLLHRLLSRFDLIFLLLDPQDEAYDRRLTRHLVALCYLSEEQVEEEFVVVAVLEDYVAYAHGTVTPFAEAGSQPGSHRGLRRHEEDQ
ncbi:hypothetical protein HPG69_001305 [Diceros bicornis minor]|uniref:MCM C-terminal AAA(+) ATPase domain-containing protein n=1 Tax=Diceros bicornis minor TaxID=77932 RepID=A0A7J7FG85_DICBM|nr:hypothetical protein HPG69_001305 [Diceros bicornis minor]